MDKSTETQHELPDISSSGETCSASEALGDSVGGKTCEEQKDENSNPSLIQFSQQLSKILSDVENKIKAESSHLNANLTADMTAVLQKERDQHTREKIELLQEIKSLYKLVDSLESTAEKKTMLSEKVIEKVLSQKDLLTCSKAFYGWKLFLNNKKHMEYKEALAARHYEVSLKRKAFLWWLSQVKARWKNRLELKAHKNVIEMQKRITNLYETKIRDLEDNLSEAGKAISSLQNQHVAYSEVPLPYSSNIQCANLNVPSFPKELPAYREVTSKAHFRTSSLDSAVCPECILEQKSNIESHTSSVPSYQHPSVNIPLSLSRDLHVVKPSITQATHTSYGGSASFPNLCRKDVGDHMPKSGRSITHHPPPTACAKPASRPQSSKTYRDKKIV